MAVYNIAESKARLSELVQKALSGEEVVIARDHRPLVKLVQVGVAEAQRRPGSARGKVKVAADFEATPEGFEEYLG